jgi:hypothetical protein
MMQDHQSSQDLPLAVCMYVCVCACVCDDSGGYLCT